MSNLQLLLFKISFRFLFSIVLVGILLINLQVHKVGAQNNQVVQVKAFNTSFKPYPYLNLSINQGEFVKLNEKGIVFINLSASDIPVKSIKVKDPSLEVASWNLSKGILEVTIRTKSYSEKTVQILDKNGSSVPKVSVLFLGQKNISKQTDSNGIISIPLALNEKIESVDQFDIPGYEIIKITTRDVVTLEVEKFQSLQPDDNKTQVPQNSFTPVENSSETVLSLKQIDTITSLRSFYEVLNALERGKISKEDQLKLDQKFDELLNQIQRGNLFIDDNLLRQISDSTGVEKDIDKIFEQVKKDNANMSRKRLVLEEKIQLVINKLNAGFENMTEDSKNKLLDDIEELEVILENNKSEFNESLNSYLTVINELKRRFFDLQELENKLSESERERLKEKRIYQQRLLLSIAVALVFALLIILLFYFRSKLKKQQKELIEANKVVKLTNENLENIVMERTYLLNKTFNELDTVLYKASHDLRAPLSSIAGISDLISRETKNKELTGLLVKTNKRMDKLLKKLSTISEIHQPGDFQEIDIHLICDDIISNLNSVIIDRNIEFNVKLEVEGTVLSIHKLVDVIIYHLLENAFFFSWIGNERKPEVELEIYVQDNMLEINVVDNGIGIEKTTLSKIFEMFYVGSELSNGNGLGLYIVQKSVDLLNGKVTVVSEEEVKTIFKVQVPIDGKGSSTLNFLSSLKA